MPQPTQYPTLVAEKEPRDAYYTSPKASPKGVGSAWPSDDKSPP